MIKSTLAIALAVATSLFSAAAIAAVDINKADQAALEGVKGIGPSMSTRMLDERKKAPFKDWPDMIERVKGVGAGNAGRYSEAGLTVNGTPFAGAPASDKPGPGKAPEAKTTAKK
jgi:competence protein ComEA